MTIATPALAETDLLARAIRRDREAFGELYERYHDRVYTYIYYRLRSEADAADLTAQVFLNAWRAIDRYQPTGAPWLAWILRIAHNAVTDFYRRRREAVALDFDLVDRRSDIDPETETERALTKEELGRAIQGLPAEQRQVLILRFLEGLDHASVAHILGKSEGAVRTIQYRALIGLRGKLKAG